MSRNSNGQIVPIYFAGPVRGGANWQTQAFQILKRKLLNISRIHGDKHCPHVVVGLSQPFVTGEPIKGLSVCTPDRTETREQFEHRWQSYAARSGCLAFWFPKETSDIGTDSSKLYALEASIQLGMWIERIKESASQHVCFGVSPKFEELYNIGKRVLDLQSLSGIVHVHTSLDELVDETLIKAKITTSDEFVFHME